MAYYDIVIRTGAHNVYIKDKELERWVKLQIEEKIFSDWSHAVSLALHQLKSRMSPKPF